MIKTVYGPPPADMERIEAESTELERAIREEEETTAVQFCGANHKKGAEE